MSLSDISTTISLDLYDHDLTPSKIKAIALDSKTRYVNAQLTRGGQQYDIGQSTAVTLTIIRPDKTGVQVTGTTYSYLVYIDGTETTLYGARAELTQTALAVSGTLQAQFMFTSGEQILRSEIFTINNGIALDSTVSEWAGEYQGYNLDELVQTVNESSAKVDAMEDDVSDLKEDFNDIQTATAEDVGKALKVKTVTNGKVTEWEFGETGVAVDSTLTIEGKAADAKATGDAIDVVKSDLNDLAEQLYTDGDAVEIQKADAASFAINSPSGLIHVKATETPIITGTVNFIDLFEIAQGVFTDSNSGVTIEITGNEVYVHGSPTKGFRFDFQNGVFFTDAFTNHASDFGDILGNVDFCELVWYEKAGYTLPSNVYIAAQRQNGTINAGGLNTHVKAIYPKVSNQYIVMYTNGAVSNLDIKFTLGMKFTSFPIEATAKAEYDTTVIRDSGYYETKALTWTLADNVYDVVKTTSITAEDPLTEGHIYAWFGDSLSQLKELPNIVSNLLNVKVYDCTFAGAPLTYGDPTKYQPTGFMSLCSQIVAGDFTPLSDALDAQEAAGTNVTEKRQHLATLEALDFSTVTDIVLLAGTNDFDNDYVNATNFVSGFSGALTTLLTEYPHLMVYVIAPPWRGDKTEGVATIPTMEDLVELEKGVADGFSLPWYDLYHRSGINSLTSTVYLTNDHLHPSDAGDALLANKCAKFLQSN